MNYRFEMFELDVARFELRRAGVWIAVEPQVLSLLLLLVSNPDRFISKDEVVEKVWNNRIVSDSAISARIKSARRAIDDDGTQQRLIRTIHGKGFRFVGKVSFDAAAVSAADQDPQAAHSPGWHLSGKPGVAVLPFRITGDPGACGFVADALADELIADLARLHWLFVIARGSSFRFRGVDVDCGEVGRALGVGYCVTGSLIFANNSVTVAVELVETLHGGVIWADSWSGAVDRLHEIQSEIALRVVSPLESRIQHHEAESARSLAPGEMTAWSAYHAGLDLMFRFNRADNQSASVLFGQSLERAPHFARAHAGLSFTRFQNAFLNYLPDRQAEAEATHRSAEQALQLDPLDPFCQLNMGRSFWLDGNLTESVEWFNQASSLSPSYAQAIYSRAWARTLAGDAENGESDAQLALSLSPLDPLRYAMIATRALGQVIKGNYAEAAELAERAARSPGAHKHIATIAAMANHFVGHDVNARKWTEFVRHTDPDNAGANFLAAFPFAQIAIREQVERALRDLRL